MIGTRPRSLIANGILTLLVASSFGCGRIVKPTPAKKATDPSKEAPCRGEVNCGDDMGASSRTDSEQVAGSVGSYGHFLYGTVAPSNPELADEEAALAGGDVLAEWLPEIPMQWPRDVQIVGQQCDQANAFWTYEEGAIVLCYEYIAHLRELVQPTASPAATHEAILRSTLFHELGHALVAEFNLPITGREEDVADQAAVWFLSRIDQSPTAIILSAHEFMLESMNESLNIDDLPYWDTHSLNRARFVNILCWAFGSAPDNPDSQSIVQSGLLATERAQGCESEWALVDNSFAQLLAPYWTE